MPIMNKVALIEKLAERNDCSKASAAKFLESFQDIITESVSEGVDVKLTGFAAFEQTTRSARNMVNPRTGERIEVPEAKVVKIRALKRLREAVSS